MGVKAKQKGFYDDLAWYWDRSRNVMIPNLQRPIATCRRVGVEVIHSRIATLTRDGRDTTRRYKALGVSTTPDAKEAEILPEVAPQGDEIVLSKLTSSVFNSTTLDNILHNMGIQNLIVVGQATDGCVESTVRTATEKDYNVILVEDACCAIAPQLHEAAVLIMGYKDAIVKSTDEMVAALEAL
jgi:nicotinamidase-related amidase